MLDKRIELADFAAHFTDGMTIGIGGWGPRRKPLALVRQIMRSGLKDLTIVAYGGADVGMPCAAGRVRIRIAKGWTDGPTSHDPARKLHPSEVGAIVDQLVASRARAKPVYGGA